MTDPKTGLPADNIPESLAAGDRSGYTSPTNIGGYLWSTIVARELGIITRGEATARLIRTLKTVDRHGAPRAERHVLQLVRRGDRQGAARSGPGRVTRSIPFASSVDNGWLGAALLVVANSDRAAGPWARRIFDRMRWDAFYNDNSDPAHQVRAGGLHPRWLLPVRAQPPGRRLPGHPHRRRPRVAHDPPLRHDGVRDPHHDLPRHHHRPDQPPPQYYATWRTFPDDVRLVVAGDAAGGRDTARTTASTSTRVPTPTAACTSCPAGAARCSRSSCPTSSSTRPPGRRTRGAATTRCTCGRSASTDSSTRATATGASARRATPPAATASTASTRSVSARATSPATAPTATSPTRR